MKDKTIKIFNLLFVLLVFFNLGNLFFIGFTYLGFDITSFDYTDMAYANMLMNIIMGGLILVTYGRILSKDWLSFRQDLKKNLMTCFNLFLLVFGIKVVAAIATSILAFLLGIDFIQSENQDILDALAGAAPMMMLLSSVIFAPIIEETIFRMGFKQVFSRKYVFIIISGLVFGLMHIFPTDLSLIEALVQGLVYVAMGLCLAWIYENKQNIYFVIIVHAFNNLFGMIVFFLLML